MSHWEILKLLLGNDLKINRPINSTDLVLLYKDREIYCISGPMYAYFGLDESIRLGLGIIYESVHEILQDEVTI